MPFIEALKPKVPEKTFTPTPAAALKTAAPFQPEPQPESIQEIVAREVSKALASQSKAAGHNTPTEPSEGRINKKKGRRSHSELYVELMMSLGFKTTTAKDHKDALKLITKLFNNE